MISTEALTQAVQLEYYLTTALAGLVDGIHRKFGIVACAPNNAIMIAIPILERYFNYAIEQLYQGCVAAGEMNPPAVDPTSESIPASYTSNEFYNIFTKIHKTNPTIHIMRLFDISVELSLDLFTTFDVTTLPPNSPCAVSFKDAWKIHIDAYWQRMHTQIAAQCSAKCNDDYVYTPNPYSFTLEKN